MKHTPDSQPDVSLGEERHIIPFPDFSINDKSDKDLQLTCTVPTTEEIQDHSGQRQELVEQGQLSGQHQEQDQEERQRRRANTNGGLPARYDDYLMDPL